MKKETKNIYSKKKEMEEFLKNFEGMPDRLLKYSEILLEGKDASPYCYQDTMSFRRLAIGLTAKCNAHCFWCYRFDPEFKHILGKELPFEKLKKIVKNTKGKFRMIHLAGLGEPTMYPRLFDAIKLVRKLSDRVKITTNASLLTKDYIDKLIKSGLTDIEISICTFRQKEEEEYRGINLEDAIEKTIYISNKTPLNIQVNTLVSNLNYKMLFSLVDKLKKAKKLSIHTIPLFESYQCRKNGVKRVSNEKYYALLKKIKSDIDKYNLNWEMFPLPEGSVIDPIIALKQKKNICFTCFEDPYISEDGELIPCVRTKPMGGVDATVGFEKVWNHPRMLKFRKNMLQENYPSLCGKLCYVKEKK